MKILIAEDDPTCQKVLQILLERWNFSAEMVQDGLAAWNILKAAQTPMLVLADWSMPEMDGVELCRKAKSELNKVQHYIILVSSRSDSKEIVQGLDSGADDYITKPFDQSELKARIRVGERILNMMESLANQEKLQGVIEMAGAVCHELNQPLQAIMGYTELLQLNLPADNAQQKWLTALKSEVLRMGGITRKIMNITRYRSKRYLGGDVKIVDLEQSV